MRNLIVTLFSLLLLAGAAIGGIEGAVAATTAAKAELVGARGRAGGEQEQRNDSEEMAHGASGAGVILDSRAKR